MKEIDFDELDRAVNSLMAPVKDADTTAVEPAQSDQPNPVIETVPDNPPVETAVTSTEDSDASDTSDTQADDSSDTADQAKTITRSRGKFMDVIRPTGTSAPAVTRGPVAKPRPALAPSASFEKAMAKEEDIDDDTDTSADLNTLDGIDVPQSPFIADAKVDKRPLGYADDNSVADDSDTTAEMPANSTSSPVPEELKSDVLSVESGGMTEIEHNVKPVQPASSEDTKSSSTATSIAPQYNTQAEAKLEEEHTPLYSPAVTAIAAQPSTKKSKLKLILTIFILLVLGSLGGIAAYTMHLFR